MDVRQLRYFSRVVETGSFTRAAELLHLAQPALGLQVRKLEDRLGVVLLTRHSRGVETTEAGRILHAHARIILDQVDRAAAELRAMGGGPRGRLLIGMTPSVAVLLAAKLIRRATRRLPDVSLNLVEDLSDALIASVEAGDIGMAFAYRTREAKLLTFEALTEEELFFAAAPGCPGHGEGPITLRDVAAHKLVMPGSPHGLRQLIEARADEAGLQLDVRYEMRSVATTREIVEDGLAATILPFGAVRREVEEDRICARPIVEPKITRTLYLVRPATRALSPTEAAIRELIVDLVGDEMSRRQDYWTPVAGDAGPVTPPTVTH